MTQSCTIWVICWVEIQDDPSRINWVICWVEIQNDPSGTTWVIYWAEISPGRWVLAGCAEAVGEDFGEDLERKLESKRSDTPSILGQAKGVADRSAHSAGPRTVRAGFLHSFSFVLLCCCVELC